MFGCTFFQISFVFREDSLYLSSEESFSNLYLASLDEGLEFLWAGLEDFDFLLESLGIGAWELGGPPEETEPAARAFME